MNPTDIDSRAWFGGDCHSGLERSFAKIHQSLRLNPGLVLLGGS